MIFKDFKLIHIYLDMKQKRNLLRIIKENLENLDGFSTEITAKTDNKLELLKDGEIVGQVYISNPYIRRFVLDGQPYVVLFSLAIKEHHRGKGYSKVLMKKVLDYLRGKTEFVMLSVLRNNKRAVKLYTNFGFEPYEDHGDVISMVKKL